VVTRSNRRCFQFSLRTLTLATLAIGLLLGWFVARARRQQELYKSIYQSNSFAYYDYQVVNDEYDPTRESWAPQWLHEKLGTDFIHPVVKVHFWDDVQRGRTDVSQVDGFCQRIDAFPLLEFVQLELGTDDRLAGIGRLPNLRRLEIVHGRQISDRGIAALVGMVNLRRLDVNGACISDEVLSHLAQLKNLREIRIHYDRDTVTDAGLCHIAGLRNLEVLVLDRCSVTDGGLACLSRLSKLRVLAMGPCDSRITDKGIENLTSLSRLQELHLHGVSATEHGLVRLARLRHLTEVRISGSTLHDGEALKKALPKCAINVSGLSGGTAY